MKNVLATDISKTAFQRKKLVLTFQIIVFVRYWTVAVTSKSKIK